MASPLVSRTPKCLSCFRQLSSSLGNAFNVYSGQQVRGKKKLAKVSTVNVKLLRNVSGYGRRGAVIPVTAGVMRNIWYPKKMAQYVTAAKAQELGVSKDASVERDSTFRSNKARRIEKQAEVQQKDEKEVKEQYRPSPITPSLVQEEQPAPQIELDLMNPDTATSILEDVLPPNLDFYRTTITVSKKISPSISASSTAAAAAASSVKESTKIHGSVSVSDIATNLKAILAEDEQGARVVISPEEISFVQEMDDKGRVKQLGVFEIEIRLDGAADSVWRTIKVNPQN